MSDHPSSHDIENRVEQLEKMSAIDVAAATNISDLLVRMSKTAFTGRTLGEAVDVMEEMIRDKAWNVLTLSGAMTMAGMSRLIMEMIERGWIHCVVATGALVGHGMVEDVGMHHYKHDPSISDPEYYKLGLNRVYDVLEPEQNLDDLELRVRKLLNSLAESAPGPLGSHDLFRYFGEHLEGNGILQVAAKAKVPIIIPACTDSELGLDFAVHGQIRLNEGKEPLRYDAFRDLRFFRRQCEAQIAVQRKLGIFTIGGGVPRNWAQQVGPYVDVLTKRTGRKAQPVRFSYGVRICPDPVHYGHLSGCTYSEGVSWGKFVAKEDGGRYAEVLLDATVGWPLVVKALMERGL